MADFRAGPPAPVRRRRFGWLVPALLALILAAGWSAFWFYAADRAKTTMAGWMEREARAGRLYRCGEQDLGGFPFRIEIRCRAAQAELTSARPPVTLTAGEVLAAAQIYQPGLLLAEIASPLTIADPAQPARLTATWSLAQVSLRGTPRNPQRVSAVADRLTLAREAPERPQTLFMANHAELHGRIAAGSASDNPVIDIAASLVAATAPELNPAAAQPIDVDIDTRLVGLRNFAPKPWADRFREIQQAGGQIEVRSARLRQGDALAVARGSLKLTRSGHLEGDLQVTATGLEKVLPAFGIDMMARSGSSRGERIGAAITLIDRLAPGAIAGAMSFLGEPAELEGRRATRMLLRFRDGAATLGPVKLGQTPPLF